MAHADPSPRKYIHRPSGRVVQIVKPTDAFPNPPRFKVVIAEGNERGDTFDTGLEDLAEPSLAEDLKMSGLEGVLNNLRPMARALGIGEPTLARLEQTNPLVGLIEALPAGTKITIEIGGQPK